MLNLRCHLVFPLLFLSAIQAQATTVLYDDSVNQLPADQAWLTYFDSSLFGGTISQTSNANGVSLSSTGVAGAGYSTHSFIGTPKNPSPLVLDALTGYSLDFQLRINSESHGSDDRAGFSVIVLSSDNTGIEIGFWEDTIFAQADTPLFTHAEEVAFDTTASEVEYSLSVLGVSYRLSANGTEILTGTTRDYTAFGNIPYTLPDFIFLGDDTSSADVDFTLGDVSFTTIPEPGVGLLAVFGLVMSLGVRRR